MRHRFPRLSIFRSLVPLAGFFLAAFFFAATFAATASAHPLPEREADPSTCGLFPRGDIYAPYLADPGRAGLSLVAAGFDSEIPEGGDSRAIVRLGGKFGLFARCGGNDLRDWQIDILAGFLGHFDATSSLDAVGWDGYYGAILTWGDPRSWSYKVGLLHDSAHVADEYTAKTGRERIGYTREEIVGGASYQFDTHWRGYFETGYLLHGGSSELQEDLRAQIGFEWVGEPRRTILREPARFYAALDIEAMEERDWQPRFTFQTGLYLLMDGGTRRYRVGVELYDGPSALGEFFFRDESYVGFGLWFDI